MHKKVFEREPKTNNEHTVAVLCLRHDFILLHHFLDFFVFRLETLIHFALLFITVTGLKSLTTMLITGTTLIKNGLYPSNHDAYYGHHSN